MSLFQVGDQAYSLNPKYKDGTRLRSRASDDSTFNGVWVPNDIYLTVRAVESDFVLVEKQDGDQGWIRTRNLKVAGEARVPGVTKDVITNELVTPDPEYVKGIKIYGCGIKEGMYIHSFLYYNISYFLFFKQFIFIIHLIF